MTLKYHPALPLPAAVLPARALLPLLIRAIVAGSVTAISPAGLAAGADTIVIAADTATTADRGTAAPETAAIPPGAIAVKGSLDPVVVSATRSRQNSFVLPLSIDAVDADRLLDGQAGVNLSETLNRIPGLVIQNRQNYAQDLQVSIRGFGSRSTFGTRGIRLLVDGIPASSPDGQGQAANFNLDAAQSVEVLRGPFATIYGNASGGVIRATTRDGAAKPELEFGYLAGSYGMSKRSLEAGGTTPEGVNYLLDASQFKTQGYREHSAAIREETNAKLVIPTDPQGRLTLVANLLAQPDTEDPSGLTAAQVAANPRGVDPGVLKWDSRKTINNEQLGLDYQRHLNDSADLEATAYVGQRRVLQFLVPSTLVANNPNIGSNGVVDLDRQYSGTDLHVTGRTTLLGGKAEFTLGGSYELQNENRKSFDSAIGSDGNTQRGTLKRSEDDQVTAANTYVQGQWSPRSDVLIAAGLRHSLVQFSTQAYLGAIPGAAQYTNTSPALGVSYQPIDTVSVYANYGRGFETPAFSELAYTPVFGPTGAVTGSGTSLNYSLRPSTSDNYEVGTKTLLDEDTRANLAAFRILTRDELAVLANVSGKSYFQNVPGTTRDGVELSVERDLAPSLTAYGAYTWLNATYSSAFSSSTASGITQVLAGNHLPGVGRRIAFGELAWHTTPASAGIELRYSDKVFANDTNTAAAGTFTTVNLRLALHQGAGNWRFEEFARIDNALNRTYSGSVIVNEANGRYFEPSPVRTGTLGLRARYDFL